jgi:hypothetical protein
MPKATRSNCNAARVSSPRTTFPAACNSTGSPSSEIGHGIERAALVPGRSMNSVVKAAPLLLMSMMRPIPVFSLPDEPVWYRVEQSSGTRTPVLRSFTGAGTLVFWPYWFAIRLIDSLGAPQWTALPSGNRIDDTGKSFRQRKNWVSLTAARGSGTLAIQSGSLPSGKSARRRRGASRNRHSRMRGICAVMVVECLNLSCVGLVYDLERRTAQGVAALPRRSNRAPARPGLRELRKPPPARSVGHTN